MASLTRIALVAALTFPTLTTANESTPMTTEQTAVLTLIETMTAAFSEGDIDGVMTTYEPGATIMFEPGSGISDEQAIRAAFAEFAALNPSFSYGGHEVIVAGDIGLHISPWKMKGALPDGTPIEGAVCRWPFCANRQTGHGAW